MVDELGDGPSVIRSGETLVLDPDHVPPTGEPVVEFPAKAGPITGIRLHPNADPSRIYPKFDAAREAGGDLGADKILKELIDRRESGDGYAQAEINAYNSWAAENRIEPGKAYDQDQSSKHAERVRYNAWQHDDLTSGDDARAMRALSRRGADERVEMLVHSGMERGPAIRLVADSVVTRDLVGVPNNVAAEIEARSPAGFSQDDGYLAQLNAKMEPGVVWEADQVPVKLREYAQKRLLKVKKSDTIAQIAQNAALTGMSVKEIKETYFKGNKMSGPHGEIALDSADELNAALSTVHEFTSLVKAENGEAMAVARLAVGSAFKERGYENKSLGSYAGGTEQAAFEIAEHIRVHPEDEQLIGQAMAGLTEHYQTKTSGFFNAAGILANDAIGSTLGNILQGIERSGAERALHSLKSGQATGAFGNAQETADAYVLDGMFTAVGDVVYDAIRGLSSTETFAGTSGVASIAGMLSDNDHGAILQLMTPAQRRLTIDKVKQTVAVNEASMMLRRASTGAIKWEPTKLSDWGLEKSWDEGWVGKSLEFSKTALYNGSASLAYTAAYVAMRNVFFLPLTYHMASQENYEQLSAEHPGLSASGRQRLSDTQGFFSDLSERAGIELLSKVLPVKALKGLFGGIAKGLTPSVLKVASRGYLTTAGKAYVGTVAIEGSQEIQQQVTNLLIHQIYESFNMEFALDAPVDFKKQLGVIIENAPMTYASTMLLALVGGVASLGNTAMGRHQVGQLLGLPEQSMAAFGLSLEQAKDVANSPPELRLAKARNFDRGNSPEARTTNSVAGNKAVEKRAKEEEKNREALYHVEQDPKTGKYQVMAPGKIATGEFYDTDVAAINAATSRNEEVTASQAAAMNASQEHTQFGAKVEPATEAKVEPEAPTPAATQAPTADVAGAEVVAETAAAGTSWQDTLPPRADLAEGTTPQADAGQAEQTKVTDALAPIPTAADKVAEKTPAVPPTREELMAVGVSAEDADMIVRAQTPADAAELFAASQGKDQASAVLSDKETIVDELNRIADQSRGKKSAMQVDWSEAPDTLRAMVKRGEKTLDQAYAYIRAKFAQAGLTQAVVDADLDREIEGTSYNSKAQFINGVLHGAIRLVAKRANIDTLREELTEQFFAATLKLGDAGKDANQARGAAYLEEAGLGEFTKSLSWTLPQLVREIRHLERQTGLRLMKKEGAAFVDVMEALSKISKGYGTTVFRNASMSDKLRAALDAITAWIATAVRMGFQLQGDHRVAAEIKRLVDAGEFGLKPGTGAEASRFEQSIQYALGGDPHAAIMAEREKIEERGILADMNKAVGSPTLMSVLKGRRMLPHPGDVPAGGLRGELQMIADVWKKVSRKKGAKDLYEKTGDPKHLVETTKDFSRNSGLFARKGDVPKLDRDTLRFLAARGFHYKTVSEMLEDILANISPPDGSGARKTTYAQSAVSDSYENTHSMAMDAVWEKTKGFEFGGKSLRDTSKAAGSFLQFLNVAARNTTDPNIAERSSEKFSDSMERGVGAMFVLGDFWENWIAHKGASEVTQPGVSTAWVPKDTRTTAGTSREGQRPIKSSNSIPAIRDAFREGSYGMADLVAYRFVKALRKHEKDTKDFKILAPNLDFNRDQHTWSEAEAYRKKEAQIKGLFRPEEEILRDTLDETYVELGYILVGGHYVPGPDTILDEDARELKQQMSEAVQSRPRSNEVEDIQKYATDHQDALFRSMDAKTSAVFRRAGRYFVTREGRGEAAGEEFTKQVTDYNPYDKSMTVEEPLSYRSPFTDALRKATSRLAARLMFTQRGAVQVEDLHDLTEITESFEERQAARAGRTVMSDFAQTPAGSLEIDGRTALGAVPMEDRSVVAERIQTYVRVLESRFDADPRGSVFGEREEIPKMAVVLGHLDYIDNLLASHPATLVDLGDAKTASGQAKDGRKLRGLPTGKDIANRAEVGVTTRAFVKDLGWNYDQLSAIQWGRVDAIIERPEWNYTAQNAVEGWGLDASMPREDLDSLTPAYDISMEDILSYSFPGSPSYSPLGSLNAFLEAFDALAETNPSVDGFALMEEIAKRFGTASAKDTLTRGILTRHALVTPEGNAVKLLIEPRREVATGSVKSLGASSMQSKIGLGRRKGENSKRWGKEIDALVEANPNASKYALAVRTMERHSWNGIVQLKKAIVFKNALDAAEAAGDQARMAELNAASGAWAPRSEPEAMSEVIPGIGGKSTSIPAFDLHKMLETYLKAIGVDRKQLEKLTEAEIDAMADNDDTFAGVDDIQEQTAQEYLDTHAMDVGVESASQEAEERKITLEGVDFSMKEALLKVVDQLLGSLRKVSDLIDQMPTENMPIGLKVQLDALNARMILNAIRGTLAGGELDSTKNSYLQGTEINLDRMINDMLAGKQVSAAELTGALRDYHNVVQRHFRNQFKGIIRAQVLDTMNRGLSRDSKGRLTHVRYGDIRGFNPLNMRRFFKEFRGLIPDRLADASIKLREQLAGAKTDAERDAISFELQCLQRFGGWAEMDLRQLVDVLRFAEGIVDGGRAEIDQIVDASISEIRWISSVLGSDDLHAREDRAVVGTKGNVIKSAVATLISTQQLFAKMAGNKKKYASGETEVQRRRQGLKELQSKLIDQEVAAKYHQGLFQRDLRAMKKVAYTRLGLKEYTFDLYESEVVTKEITRVAHTVLIDGKYVRNLHQVDFQSPDPRATRPGIPLLEAMAISNREKGFQELVKKHKLIKLDLRALREAMEIRNESEEHQDLLSRSKSVDVTTAYKAAQEADAIWVDFKTERFHKPNERETFGFNEKDTKKAKKEDPSNPDVPGRLTRGQALQMMLSLEDPGKFDEIALEGYDAKTLKEISAALDPAYKAYGYSLRDYRNNVLQQRLVEASLRTSGTSWEVDPLAWSVKRTHDPSYNEKMLGDVNRVVAALGEDRSISRIGSDIDYAFSASTVFLRMGMAAIDLDERGSKTAHALWTSLHDNKVRDDMEQINPEVAKMLQARLADDIAQAHKDNILAEGLESAANRFNKTMTKAILAWRPSTLIRQFPAILNGLMNTRDGNGVEMVGHLLFAIGLRDGTASKVFNSQGMQARFMEGDLLDTAPGLGGRDRPIYGTVGKIGRAAGAKADKYTGWGMKGLGIADTGLNGIMMIGQYRMSFVKELQRNGGNVEAADQYATSAVNLNMAENAQPFTNISKTSLHRLASKEVFFGAYNRFKSEVFKHTGMVASDLSELISPSDGRGMIKSGASLMARVFIVGILNALMLDVISWLFDDEEEYANRRARIDSAPWTHYLSGGLLDIASGLPLIGEIFAMTHVKVTKKLFGLDSTYYTPRSALTTVIAKSGKELGAIMERDLERLPGETEWQQNMRSLGALATALGTVAGGVIPNFSGVGVALANVGNLVSATGEALDSSRDDDSARERADVFTFKRSQIYKSYSAQIKIYKAEKTAAGANKARDLEAARDLRVGKLLTKSLTMIDNDKWVGTIASSIARKKLTQKQFVASGLGADLWTKAKVRAKEIDALNKAAGVAEAKTKPIPLEDEDG